MPQLIMFIVFASVIQPYSGAVEHDTPTPHIIQTDSLNFALQKLLWLFYLRGCSQWRAQRVLHGLWQDRGALFGHDRYQAAVLGEKHGQVGTAASSTDTIPWRHTSQHRHISSTFLLW